MADSQTAAGESIGTIIARPRGAFSSEYEANKYLLCDGSHFEPSEYPKLFAILGSAALPDLRGRFLEGAAADAAGVLHEAGLPNIRGEIHVTRANTAYQSGALYYIRGSGIASSYANGLDGNIIGIDASRSSSIYKDGIKTVQPPSYTVAFYIRAK